MSITEIWRSRFAAGCSAAVSRMGVVQLLWYDGLVLAYIPEDRGALLIAFMSESEDKRSRLFVGYLVRSEVLDPEEADFLDSQLPAASGPATEDADKYEAATTRLLNRWRDASGFILIHADPAFTRVFRSRIVSKADVEDHWCKMEEFYALSTGARAVRHAHLVQLLEPH